MEVEVKLRLGGQEAYERLEALLLGGAAGAGATYRQENYFFDGDQRQLNSRRVVLRLRFYNGDEKAVITLKGEQILRDGIGTASEVEEAVDASAARAFLEEPSALLQLDSPLLQGLARQYSLSSLECLGGFRNLRKEFAWRGFTLELDATSYEWGQLYELECETDRPEALRDELEAFLKAGGIDYRYSTASKFANFIKRTLE